MISLLSLFRRRPKTSQAQAHLTYSSGKRSRTGSRTSRIIGQQLWIWPLVAIAVLYIAGNTLRSAIEQSLNESLRSQLQTLLDVEVSMLRNWLGTQKTLVDSVAAEPQLATNLVNLLESSLQPEIASDTKNAAPTTVPSGSLHSELSRTLNALTASENFNGYFVLNADKRIVACSDPHLQNLTLDDEHNHFVDRVLDGETVIRPPFASGLARQTSTNFHHGGPPAMFACSPLRNSQRQVIGALGLLMDPDRDFTRIMQLGRTGRSGETYAFNREGTMVSRSRFEEDLVMLGILPDELHSTSLLNVQLRDPGQNTVIEGRPRMRLSDMPLTQMAQSAIGGESGVAVKPYRDYRGVPVVGAWSWIPELQAGVATEIDHDEAYAPLAILQTAFWILFGMLAAASVVIFIFTVVVTVLKRDAQEAALEAKELGQYRLEAKIGAGAMGVVYKAYHSMMQRATAVKLLNMDKADETAIQRFEQEVQIVCQLSHPNTISIYDYGRTPEGVFYYAMEYLDGIDLQQLVERYGPQPEGRVIHILKQVCGSLYEAHSRGLVHRDVKPSNIMINVRGGEADIVKVLDFGLVKSVNSEQQAILTAPDAINGTALYISPEAIQSPATVDARSDIYALGAVGYFLLTGQPVFSGPTFAGLLQQHISAMPLPPSLCLGKPVSEELESALMACLSKNAAGRPENTRALSDLLMQVPTAHAWTRDEAERWWSRVQRGLSPRIPRIGRSVTCRFEQTMVNMTEEELNWRNADILSSQDDSQATQTLHGTPWNPDET